MEHCHTCESGCGGCGGCSPKEVVLTRPQAQLLSRFAQTPFLPLCRFLMTSSREDELESVGLEPVFLETGKEDLPAAREIGALLTALADKGLITLDYELPLSNCDYGEYRDSPLFALFRQTVEEGASRPGFLFDTAVLEKGSMALTALGQAVLEQLEP